MATGVYIIQNNLNKKCYVGSAVNLHGREYKHFYRLRKGLHTNPHLQASFNKHGEAAFKFWVAEECPRDKLIEREQWWIDMFEPAYNIAKIAGGSQLGLKRSDISKARMSRAQKGRKHSQDTLEKMSFMRKGRAVSTAHRESLSRAAKLHWARVRGEV